MYVASQAWDSKTGRAGVGALTPFEDACRLSAMPQCTLCRGQCACVQLHQVCVLPLDSEERFLYSDDASEGSLPSR